MGSRITWQNVAAPDLSGAAQAVESAGRMMSSGFTGFGTAMDDIRDRQKTDASAQAMSEMMKISESGGWDAAMASGGLDALGIKARDATPELLKMMAGRRGDLLGNEQTMASIDGQELMNERNQWLQGQAVEDDVWSDRERERGEATYQKGLKDTSRKLDLQEQARKIWSTSSSKEEADRTIRNLPDLTADESKFMLGYAGENSDGAYTPLPETLDEVSSREDVKAVEASLAEREEALNVEFSSPLLRIYSAAVQKYDGVGNAFSTLEQQLVKDPAIESDEKLLAKSTGDLRNLLNKLQNSAAGKGLPPEVIAMVVEQNLEGASWFRDGELNVNVDAAEDMLAQLGDAESRAGLGRVKRKIDSEYADIANIRKGIKNFTSKYAVSVDRGNAKNQQKHLDAWNKILSGAAPAPSSDAGTAVAPGVGGVGTDPSTLPIPVSFGGDAGLPPSIGLPENIINSGRNSMAPANPNIDPRALAAQVGFGRAKTALGNVVSNAATGVDRGLGYVAGAGTQLVGRGTEKLAGDISMLGNPEAGTEVFQAADSIKASANELYEKGLFGAAPDVPMEPDQIAAQEASAAINTLDQESPGSGQEAATKWATENPSDALTLIGEEIGIPRRYLDPARQAMDTLKASSNLPPETKAELKKTVKNFLRIAREEYAGKERIPALEALLREGAKWARE